MHFTCTRQNFVSGALLEASQLNTMQEICMNIGMALLKEQSDGIIQGLHVRVARANNVHFAENTLYIEPGIFKLSNSIQWLDTPLAIECPSVGDYFLHLTFNREDPLESNVWRLDKEAPLAVAGYARQYSLQWLPVGNYSEGSGLVLCRLNATTLLPKEHWLFGENTPQSLNDFLRKTELSDTIHLEYAQSSGRSTKATLLPSIQRFLAQYASRGTYLKQCLLAGQYILEDMEDISRKDAIRALVTTLDGSMQQETPPQKTAPVERNLAG